jgi:hypothetical protein
MCVTGYLIVLGDAKLRLILLGLKYAKCILLAYSSILIHMPKGPVLWVVVHCRLVCNQEECFNCSVNRSSKHFRNGACVPIYRILYSRILGSSKCITCQITHLHVMLGPSWMLVLMY